MIFRICIPVAIVVLIIVIIEVVFLTNMGKSKSILTEETAVSSTTTVEKGEPGIKQLSDEEIEECFNIVYLNDGTISLSKYTGDYTDIKIPKKYKGTKITTIDNFTFYGCTAPLTTIDCSSVTTIGKDAFKLCSFLTTIDCSSVKTIGERAFEVCDSLTTVTFGSSLETIGDEAFYDCSSLESFEVDEDNPNFCSEDGVLFNKAKTELIRYPAGKKETSYTVPESVETIGNYAFSNCTSLTKITCPNVTSIGDCAFCWCSSLTTIDCSSVTSIGEEAFEYCDALTEIDCKNVISIGDKAFVHCTFLTTIDCPNVTRIGKYAFYRCTSLKNVPTVK